jgi:hypothetical protein
MLKRIALSVVFVAVAFAGVGIAKAQSKIDVTPKAPQGFCWPVSFPGC